MSFSDQAARLRAKLPTASKQPSTPIRMRKLRDGRWEVTDRRGRVEIVYSYAAADQLARALIDDAHD